MIWLGFAIGALGGLLAGAILGTFIGREQMRDEIEARWYRHLRRQQNRNNPFTGWRA